MTEFNVYFGLADGELKCKYQYTKEFKNETEAIKDTKRNLLAFYYKYEGTHHIPSFIQISEEAEYLNRDVEKLITEHIHDLFRYFIIPTEVDIVSSKDLKYL